MSCKSVTGFVWYQILAPIRTLFYSKPESDVCVTEMMIYHSLLFIFVIFCKQSEKSRVVIYLFAIILFIIYSHVFIAPEIFIPDAYGTKTGADNRHQKTEWIYGAGFWSMCHGPYKIEE